MLTLKELTKAAADKEWKKLEKLLAWQLASVFATSMDICHLQHAALEPKYHEGQKAGSCSEVTL